MNWRDDPDVGYVPDSEIAARYGVTVSAVKAGRRARGIKSTVDCAAIGRRTARVWDAPWCSDGDIGRLPDKAIASRHNVDVRDVCAFRQSQGIPRTKLDTDAIDWANLTNQQVAEATGLTLGYVATLRKNGQYPLPPDAIDWSAVPLGAESDAVLATRLGVSTDTVHRRRRARGIKPFGQIDWNLVDLGERSDGEIATEYGVDKTTVRQARQSRGIDPFVVCSNKAINWDALPLGEVPDAVIADRVGIKKGTVSGARQRRGIQSYRSKLRETLESANLPFGQMPDKELARQSGYAPSQISIERNRRGIPRYHRPARVCVICGDDFIPKSDEQVTCPEPRGKGDKQCRRIWKRQLRDKDAPGPLGLHDRYDILVRDGFACQYCGRRPPDVVLHVDHIVPRNKGGGNDADNLVTSCYDCNTGKKDRHAVRPHSRRMMPIGCRR